ncbi:hypothetical protein G9587_002015 [Salmonella enterica]|nr:hypothetical protein [Salmonella enterica]EEL1820778.1 hypothetical protein [Salmonella enterica]EGM3628688.1 hypothetical protein [Salmonella enterica subsp. enterica serovar Anatum]EHJ3698826.1 hypothetical protein [Salmonella enterica]HAK8220433.1 hypothetical protein [Salmonella enterica]
MIFNAEMVVFPAPAGINRTATPSTTATTCVPRASGDKPAQLQFDAVLSLCSPRQRG